jgi:hypothetical protein
VAHRTTFDLSDLEAGAELLEPGALMVGAWGGAQWDSERGVWLRSLQLDAGQSTVTLDGVAGRSMNLAVVVDRLDGADLGELLGHPLAGTWRGSVTAKGPPEDFELVASIGGDDGAGALVLAGRVDASRDTPRWGVNLELGDLHVEALEPALGRPLVLGGVARAEGVGARPSTLLADGRWRGREQLLYGQPIDAVDASFRIHDGVLDLLPSRVDGVLGQMTLDGSYGLLTGALELSVESDLSPARLRELGTDGLDGRGRVRAQVSREPGDAGVRVVGTARYAPFVYGGDVRAASVVAPFDVTVRDGATRGTFDLQGSGVSAYGLTARGASGQHLRLDREADGRIVVGGTVTTPGVAYGERLTTSFASTAFTFRSAGAHRTVDATTTVGPHELVGLPAGGGVVVTHLADDDVRAEVHLGTGARSTLDTVARYDLATSELVLDSLAYSPTPRATWRAVEPVRLRLTGGGVADARVHLESALGEVKVTGALGSEGPLDGVVELKGLELDHLTELWPDTFDLGGRLDLAATVRGDAADPVVDATLSARRVFANGVVRWLDVDGDLALAGGVARPRLALAVAGRPLAHLRGDVPVAGGLSALAPALDADATWQLALVPGAPDRLGTLLPALDGRVLPAGALSGSLDATGPLGDPALRLAVVAEVPAPGFQAPARAELELVRRGDDLTFTADVREDLALRATTTGRGLTRAGDVFASLTGRGGPGGEEVDATDPDAWLHDLVATVVVAALPTAGFGALAGTPPLGGDLAGSFVVSGRPTRPVVDGGLGWDELTIGGQPIGGGFASLVPGPAGYQLEVVAVLPDGGGLEVRGAVPVDVDLLRDAAEWSTGELALDVSGAGVPITLLGGFSPAVRGVAGLVGVAGRIGGPLHDPQPDLTVHGEGLALLYRPLLLATEGASLDAHVTGEAVTFDVVAPTAPARQFTRVDLEPGAEPTVRASGEVTLAEWAPAHVSAEVHFEDGAWVAATDLTKIRTTGDLTAEGDWPEVKVKGDLALVQGLVRIEAAGAEGAAPLVLAPTLAVVRPTSVAASAPPPPEEPGLLLDANVDVDLGRNLQLDVSMPFVDQLGELGAAVSRVDLSTRVGGRVKVRAKDGAPVLVGELELVEGTVRMMRSTFDLQEGHVTFTGGDPYEDAGLDVTARMQVTGSTLDLRIGGTPVDPVFTLSSEEYPDPTEQMVILVTGSAPDELSADQGAGAALGLLWSSAFSGMRLGSFSIEPSGAVRLGMPVSRRIYSSTTWSMSQDPTVNQLTFEADWSLSQHLVLNGGVGDRNSWGDVYWEWRF